MFKNKTEKIISKLSIFKGLFLKMVSIVIISLGIVFLVSNNIRSDSNSEDICEEIDGNEGEKESCDFEELEDIVEKETIKKNTSILSNENSVNYDILSIYYDLIELIELNDIICLEFTNSPQSTMHRFLYMKASGICYYLDDKDEENVILYVYYNGTINLYNESSFPLYAAFSNIQSISFLNTNTSNITNFSDLFSNLDALKTLNLGSFDTSNATDMSGMFSFCEELESVDVSGFDTSNVTDMSNMFKCCHKLKEINVSNFDTKNVSYFNSMFYDCRRLTKLDLSNFDMSNCYVDNIISCCVDLNIFISPYYSNTKLSLSDSFVSSSNLEEVITSIENNSSSETYYRIYNINYNLNGGTVNNNQSYYVYNIGYTLPTPTKEFYNFSGWYTDSTLKTKISSISPTQSDNITIYAGWEKANVTLSSSFMSKLKSYLNKNNITTDITKLTFDNSYAGYTRVGTETVDGTYVYKNTDEDILIYWPYTIYAPEDCSNFFANWSKLSSINFNNFNTSNVTSMNSMFLNNNSLTYLNISNWDVSNVTNFYHTFDVCSSIKSLDLSGWNTSSAENMQAMFGQMYDLEELVLGEGFDTSNVTTIRSMFYQCCSLTNLDLSKLNFSNVENMQSMFFECIKLEKIIFPNSLNNTLTNIAQLFYKCESLKSVNLSSFDLSCITYYDLFLDECDSLIEITLPTHVPENITIQLSKTFALKDGDKIITSIDSSNCSSLNNKYTYYSEFANLNYVLSDYGVLDETYPTYYIYSFGLDTLPTPICTEGYTFYGWYTDSSFTKPITSISSKQTGDITLYAKLLCDINIDPTKYEFNYLDDDIIYTPTYQTAMKEDITLKVEYLVDEEYTTTIPKNAGSYKIRITKEEDETYSALLFESEEELLIINKINLNSTTLDCKIKDKPYTGLEQTQDIILKYKTETLVENTDYKLTYLNNKELGTAWVVIKALNLNYEGQLEYSFIIYSVSIDIEDGNNGTPSLPSDEEEIFITNKDYELNIKLNNNVFSYNFNVQKPTVEAYIDKVLIPSNLYTVEYSDSDSINNGTYTVTIYASGEYIKFDKVVFNYEITKIDINDVLDSSNIEKEVIYTSNEIKPSITLEYLENPLSINTDYEVTYLNNTDIGQASIIIKGINNFEGEYIKTFEIVKSLDAHTLVVSLKDNINSFEYTGNMITPEIIVKYAGAIRYDYTTDLLTINPTDVGTYTLNVTINNEELYAKGSVEFSIISSSLETKDEGIITDEDNYHYQDENENILDIEIEYITTSYNFKLQQPKVKVTLNGNVISNDNYNIEYSKNSIDVGNYTISVWADNDNIKFNKVVFNYEITKIDINDIIDNSEIEAYVIYTGSDIIQKISYSYLTRKLVEYTDYKVTYTNNKEVGDATVKVEGINNFEGEMERSFKIIISDTIEHLDVYLDNNSFKYNGSTIIPNIEVYYKGVQRFDFTIEIYDEYNQIIEDPISIGKYRLLVTVNSTDIFGFGEQYYTIELNEFDDPNQEDSQLQIKIDNNEFDYNFNIQKPNVTVYIEGNEISSDLYEIECQDSINAGTYIITIWADNDTIKFSKVTFEYVINSIEIKEDMLKSKIKDFNFTGLEILQELELIYQSYPLIENTDYEVIYNDNIEVGMSYLTINGINNYKGSLEYTFNINKVEIINEILDGQPGSNSQPIQDLEYSINLNDNQLDISISFNTISFNFKDQKPDVTVLLNGNKLDSIYYTVKYSADESINTGLYKVTVSSSNDSISFNEVTFYYQINAVNLGNVTKD